MSTRELYELEETVLGEGSGEIPDWVTDIEQAREQRVLAGSPAPEPAPAAPDGSHVEEMGSPSELRKVWLARGRRKLCR
jgi:hypothetical protein